MNKLVLALTTASLLALTACGGGSDEENVQPIQPTNPAANSGGSTGGDTGNNNGGNTGDSNSAEFTPAQIATWSVVGTNKLQFKSNTEKGSNDTKEKFNKITVAGKEVEIIPTGVNLATNTYNNNQNTYKITTAGNAGATGTAYARYGLVADGTNSTVSVFYQGEPTSNMPTTGSNITYKGRAFAFRPSDNTAFGGDSTFQVDFGGRKLTGTMSNWKEITELNAAAPNPVSISASISGNTFKGSNNQGKFYGDNAQNLAGSFADKTQKIQGAFGANKQQ